MHSTVASFFIFLEAEIDKRAKPWSIQCSEAENERRDTDYKGNDVLPTVVIGEIHLILYLQSELGEGKEREESRHQHCDITVRVVAEMERRKIKGEESFDEEPREVDALDTEETTGEHYYCKGADDRRNLADSFVELS